MSISLGNGPSEGVGSFKSLNGVTVLSTGTAAVLQTPCGHWAVTTLLTTGVGASTSATILLQGTATSSSDAPFGTIITITASTDGETTYSSAAVAKQVRLNLTALSSSGAVHGWIAGVP